MTVELLARKHFRDVYGLCRSLLGNDAEAEDAAQEVFLTATRRAADGAGKPWLMKVAVYTCFNARRRRRPLSLEHEPDAPLDPGPPLDAGEDLARVREAIARLPERYGAVLALRHQQELTHDQISDVLDLSPGAVRVLLHRATARLREEVRKR